METEIHVYINSGIVCGFCMNNLHAHLVLCSQTSTSERSTMEEGGK